jgi:multidrug resistance efflux pump
MVLVLAAGGVSPTWAAERELAFAVRGVVEQVLVKVGQKVEAGAPLARLDSTLYRIHQKASGIILESAAIELKFADKKHRQEKELYDDVSTSLESLETTIRAAAKARARHARAQAKADSAAWKLERATLRAPAAGTVRAIPGYPGLIVNPAAAIMPVVVLDIP